MRKHKRKYTWFPVLGSDFVIGDDSYLNACQFQEVIPELSDASAPNQSNGSLAVFPVIPDFTTFQNPNATNSLRDVVEGQDWLLKRLVGKAHIHITSSPTLADGIVWTNLLVTLGFFVARANDDNQALVGLDDSEVDPQTAFNIEQPWLWRRTWLMGNRGSTSWLAFGANGSSNSQGFAGSVADGPHIDSKVARRIRKEQRLWGALTAMGLSDSTIGPVTGTKFQQPSVRLALDVRVLGAMRKAHNVSAF